MTPDLTRQEIEALASDLKSGMGFEPLALSQTGESITQLLRQLDAAEAQAARVLEAFLIAGPIALADFRNHPFILNEEEQQKVAIIGNALEVKL